MQRALVRLAQPDPELLGLSGVLRSRGGGDPAHDRAEGERGGAVAGDVLEEGDDAGVDVGVHRADLGGREAGVRGAAADRVHDAAVVVGPGRGEVGRDHAGARHALPARSVALAEDGGEQEHVSVGDLPGHPVRQRGEQGHHRGAAPGDAPAFDVRELLRGQDFLAVGEGLALRGRGTGERRPADHGLPPCPGRRTSTVDDLGLGERVVAELAERVRRRGSAQLLRVQQAEVGQQDPERVGVGDQVVQVQCQHVRVRPGRGEAHADRDVQGNGGVRPVPHVTLGRHLQPRARRRGDDLAVTGHLGAQHLVPPDEPVDRDGQPAGVQRAAQLQHRVHGEPGAVDEAGPEPFQVPGERLPQRMGQQGHDASASSRE